MMLKSGEIRIPTDKWIIANVDYMGFYRVNYDIDMWQKLILQLQDDHTVSMINHRDFNHVRVDNP